MEHEHGEPIARIMVLGREVTPINRQQVRHSVFKLTAWTDDPSRVSKTKRMQIPEAKPTVVHCNPHMERYFAGVEPYLMKKSTLSYSTIIHIRSITDFMPCPSSSDEQPSTNGDSGHDGNPDWDFGSGRHGGPRIHGFRCHQGMTDGTLLLPKTGGRRLPETSGRR